MKPKKNNGFSSETEAKILRIINSCKTEDQLKCTYNLPIFYGRLCRKFYDEANFWEKLFRLFYINSDSRHYMYLYNRISNFRMHCYKIIQSQFRTIFQTVC